MTDNILEALEKQQILEETIKYRRKKSTKADRFKVKFVPTTFNNGETGVTVIMSKIIEK